jgi:hypothetical protein
MSLESSVNGKDDAVKQAEVKTDISNRGKLIYASPGSETMACLIRRTRGNQGGPAISFMDESMPERSMKREDGK